MNQSTKKVVVISGYWPSEANPISGIFVVQQVAALCRAGCEVTVVVGKTAGKYNERPLMPEELGLQEGRVKLFPVLLFRFPEVLSAYSIPFAINMRLIGTALSRTINEIAFETGPFGACMVHDFRYLGLSIDQWSACQKIPTIAFIHGVDPFISKNMRLVKPYVRRALEHIGRVVIVGSPLSAFASELGIDDSKVVIVHNGTDIPLLADIQSVGRARTGHLRIVSVSNLVALKGIDDNIRALSLLQVRDGRTDWQYRIVGDGPERERLVALVDFLGLNSKVEFLGRLPYSLTMEEIADADIFSLPSWGDAFGIVYLEAMARMKPTIGCAGSGAAETITDGVDGILVSMKDADALSQAFKRLFENPQLREKLGREARKTAERFSWDANASTILELFGFPRARCYS